MSILFYEQCKDKELGIRHKGAVEKEQKPFTQESSPARINSKLRKQLCCENYGSNAHPTDSIKSRFIALGHDCSSFVRWRMQSNKPMCLHTHLGREQTGLQALATTNPNNTFRTEIH